MLQVVQLVNPVALPVSVQLPDGAKRSLNPFGQGGQKMVKGCHLSWSHDYFLPGKEGVSIPVDNYGFSWRWVASPRKTRHN